jgi:hypothetical protein
LLDGDVLEPLSPEHPQEDQRLVADDVHKRGHVADVAGLEVEVRRAAPGRLTCNRPHFPHQTP